MIARKAFSLIEVIVSAVIFMLTMSCIFGAVATLKSNKAVTTSDTMLKKARCGEMFLESLRREVDPFTLADGTSKLQVGTFPIPAAYIDCPGTYAVELDAGTGARKVKLFFD